MHPTSVALVCALPPRIHQHPAETPKLALEVSVNGRDWTSSEASRAVTGGGTVSMACPPVPREGGLIPSLGSPAGGTRVTIEGTGFAAAWAGSLPVLTNPPQRENLSNASNRSIRMNGFNVSRNASLNTSSVNFSATMAFFNQTAPPTPMATPAAPIWTTGSQDYKALVKCGWGDYPMTAAQVVGEGQLVCDTPAHGVAESLPLRFTLNDNVVHEYDDVRFSYTRLEWLDPSSAPASGGSAVTVYGYNLKPPPGNSTYQCRFGVSSSVAEWSDVANCNPLSGICYPGGLVCVTPALSPPLPPAGVDWGAGSLCARDPSGRVSASSQASSADDVLSARPRPATRPQGPGPASHVRAAGGRSTPERRGPRATGTAAAAKAFDGVLHDGGVWRASEGMPQWLQYEFVGYGDAEHRLPADEQRRVRIAGYGITPRPALYDAGEQVEHELFAVYDSPMTWQLLASMDGVEWAELHRVDNFTAWRAGHESKFEVPPWSSSTAEAGSMRFFRLHVTSAVGRPDGRQLLALSEFALYAPAPALARVPVSVLVNADDTPSEGLEMYLHRPLSFHDFHPKSGNLNGGTEVHVYGSGFVDHPDLRCRWELVFTIAVFVSPTEIICPAPERFATAPQLSLTLNGRDFAYCSACVWRPGRCADSHKANSPCSWDCDSSSRLATDPASGRPYCAKEDGSCFYEQQADDAEGCRDEVPYDFFTYYRYPVVQEVAPTAGPDIGGTRITVSGVFLQPQLGGHDLFCRLGDAVFRAQYLRQLSSHYVVCTTPAALPLGYNRIDLSFNGQEWDSRSEVNFFVYPAVSWPRRGVATGKRGPRTSKLCVCACVCVLRDGS